jgi:hypothetical protein
MHSIVQNAWLAIILNRLNYTTIITKYISIGKKSILINKNSNLVLKLIRFVSGTVANESTACQNLASDFLALVQLE